jgi:hypothetical protein
MTKTNVLAVLLPYKVTPEDEDVWSNSLHEAYRLDDGWILFCSYQMKNGVLADRILVSSVPSIWSAPPTNFTGTWGTYYVNGQKSHEIQYQGGKYQGEYIDYYPSGRIMYRGVYKAGARYGAWVWYSENGTTNSVKHYPLVPIISQELEGAKIRLQLLQTNMTVSQVLRILGLSRFDPDSVDGRGSSSHYLTDYYFTLRQDPRVSLFISVESAHAGTAKGNLAFVRLDNVSWPTTPTNEFHGF